MLLDPKMSLSADARKLLKLYRGLAKKDQHSLFAFAEFLAQRQVEHPPSSIPLTPKLLERPAKETVIAAIKRLSAGYPMLDKSSMLQETSTLMTQHVMQGKEAVKVIDELEVVFQRAYQKFEAQQSSA